MHIPSWISTNVLNFETDSSRAYISNSITGELFWLKESSSDLWKILIEATDFNQIVSYAKKKDFYDELDDFLRTLESCGLIFLKDDLKVLPNKNATEPSSFDNGRKLKNDWTLQNILENKLSRIQINLTYKCNERCIHCFCDRSVDDVQITFEQLKPIIDDAYELGATQIVLSGGECTLVDDFLKIAQYIKSKRIELIVFTNGQKLYNDKDFFKKFVELYPYSVGLSLYSMDPAIHDKITQVEGSQIKTLNVIKKLRENNIPVEVKCFLTKYNAEHFSDVIKFAEENACIYTVDVRLEPNKTFSNLYTEITDEQLYSFFKKRFNGKIDNFSKDLNDEYLNDFPCLSGRTTLDIDPFLNVRSCPSADFIFANLNEISLKKLWNSGENILLTKWKEINRSNFKGCFIFDYCKYCDFCPAKYTNDHMKKNVLCRNAKIKMKVVQDCESRI